MVKSKTKYTMSNQLGFFTSQYVLSTFNKYKLDIILSYIDTYLDGNYLISRLGWH